MSEARSHMLLAAAIVLVACSAAPRSAQAQDIFKRLKEQTAKRIAEQRAKLDSAVMKKASGTVDSALEKSGRGADAVMTKVNDVANNAIATTERNVKQVVGGSDPASEVAARLATGRAVFEDVRFVEGSDQIEPASVEILKHLAAALAKTPGTFLIEGHTDQLPPPGDAQTLSQRRATSVKTQLAANGVPAERMVAVGYGATRPNAANPQANARIEVARAQ